jgi:colanic acid/amylovoran biosynthesis glycosyltransferase
MPSHRETGRIGYVLRKFPVLSETFVLQEILALEARGVPVHILSLARPNDPRYHQDLPRLQASVSYVPGLAELRRLLRYNRSAARRFGPAYLRALAYAASKGKPALLMRQLQAGYVAHQARRRRLRHLHAHFATSAASVAHLASRISTVPYSFTAHAYDIFGPTVDQRVLATKVEHAQFVVTVSDFNKSYLERLGNAASRKVVRIYNGIDLDRFSPDGKPASSPFTILCVARLVEKKGLLPLVQACRHLRDRGVEFRCWIVGKGKLQPTLAMLIQRWQLQDRVKLLGVLTQAEVLARYRSAHAYVLPCAVASTGDRDGLPVSIVEALACGLPVVTTPLTGIPEVVHHEQNGLLVPPADPTTLAAAIGRLIHEPALYERLRARARDSVAAAFDVRRSAESLHALFERG